MANYPGSLPSLTNPISTDYLTSPAHAESHSSENDEIVAIATELGTLASGSYSTVRDRFEAVEASLSTKIGSIVGAATYLVRYNATSDGLESSGYVPADFAPVVHTHDDRYYTETEADALLDGKIDTVVGDVNEFATFTGTGQIVESGYGAADFDADGTSVAGILAHEALHTSVIEHNPYVVGSKEVDETGIADNKILYFHFESNTIKYGDVNAIQQEDVEDWVAAMMQTGVGPTTWTYSDALGQLNVDLPQAVDVTSSVQFGSVNIAGNFTFPTGDGALGQIIQTDGSGTLTWTDKSAASGGGELFAFALGGM